MAQVVRVYEPVDSYQRLFHIMSILATDTDFSYIFRTSTPPAFDSATRVKTIMDTYGQQVNPKNSNDFLSLAIINMGYFVLGDPTEATDVAAATHTEQAALNQALQDAQYGTMYGNLLAQSLRTADVFQDFPDLEDQLSSTDPDQAITSNGMTNFVLTALGDIDPKGPNGWLLNDTNEDGTPSSTKQGIIVSNADGLDENGKPTSTGDN